MGLFDKIKKSLEDSQEKSKERLEKLKDETRLEKERKKKRKADNKKKYDQMKEEKKEQVIQSDPRLQEIYARMEKDSEKLKKTGEKLDDLLGLPPSDDDDDD